MRNLSMPIPILAFFCYITVASSAGDFISHDIFLDCGSLNTSGKDGRNWKGDIRSEFFPSEEHNRKSNTSKVPKEEVANKAPFLTARISYSQFTYVFPVTYNQMFVRLHFYPASYSGFDRSKDLFTVKAGSSTLLRNFSAFVAADYLHEKTLFKEFCIKVQGDQRLILTFIPSSPTFYAFINGIEVLYMPEDLYLYRSELNDIMAFEMAFRLNVAGSLIPPINDTGFFREWSPDNRYFKSRGLTIHNSSFRPNYEYIQEYDAPDDIYRSATSMGKDRIRNLQSKLTWGLPVDSRFNYLVRLHFCEIGLDVNHVGERRFKIYIDHLLFENDADVMLWTHDNKYAPVYRDYLVMIKNNGVEDTNYTLKIDLQPIPESKSQDAILNGMEVFKLSNSDGDSQDLVIFPQPKSPKQREQSDIPTTKKSKTERTILIAIGSGVGFLVVLTSVCCMVFWKLSQSRRYGSYYSISKWCCCCNRYKGKSTGTNASPLPKELCRHFSIDDIRTATDNFHQELIIGRGGFGYVYKGFIDEGTMIVAIKRLNPESRQGAREFRTEIGMLSQLRHGHLVSLIGYCNDEGEMILVYEYMSNGTLSEHLFNTKNDPLTWKQRLEICLGAARGLHYLHTCMKNPIIHRDVKATNILLDEKLGSKVSDFGLSKMGLNQIAVSTMVKGTFGYLDPEYARRQQVTDKSDVYSFGVVLLEVLCGRKALDQKFDQEQLHLANWARKCIERGTIYQIIDSYLKGKIAPECFKVYVEVAESCVRDQGIQRPTMNNVMEKLEFALELQQDADAAQEEINPSGDFTYQEVLSFCVSGPMLESDINPFLDSDSVTSTS